jgi:hypothetical protein
MQEKVMTKIVEETKGEIVHPNGKRTPCNITVSFEMPVLWQNTCPETVKQMRRKSFIYAALPDTLPVVKEEELPPLAKALEGFQVKDPVGIKLDGTFPSIRVEGSIDGVTWDKWSKVNFPPTQDLQESLKVTKEVDVVKEILSEPPSTTHATYDYTALELRTMRELASPDALSMMAKTAKKMQQRKVLTHDEVLIAERRILDGPIDALVKKMKTTREVEYQSAQRIPVPLRSGEVPAIPQTGPYIIPVDRPTPPKTPTPQFGFGVTFRPVVPNPGDSKCQTKIPKPR